MVKIRLQRHGRHKLPFYRIVACDERCRRDGRFIEILGTYNPMRNPPEVRLDDQLVIKWIKYGAQPSASVRRLIEKKMPGFLSQLEEQRRAKIRERRRKRKERLGLLKSQSVASA